MVSIYKPTKPTIEECREFNEIQQVHTVCELTDLLEEIRRSEDLNNVKFVTLSRDTVEVYWYEDKEATKNKFADRNRQYEIEMAEYKAALKKAYEEDILNDKHK